MSEFLSNEDRIERLEAQITALISLFNSTADGNHQIQAALLKCVLHSNEDHLRTLRLISLNSSFGDAESRQQLTDMLARYESRNDSIAALVNDLPKPEPPGGAAPSV